MRRALTINTAFNIVSINWRREKSVPIQLAVAVIIKLRTKGAQSNQQQQPPLTRGMYSALKVMHRDTLCDQLYDREKKLQLVMHEVLQMALDYDDQMSHTHILKAVVNMARRRTA